MSLSEGMLSDITSLRPFLFQQSLIHHLHTCNYGFVYFIKPMLVLAGQSFSPLKKFFDLSVMVSVTVIE